MTRGPDFEDLVGPEPDARLRRVHALLLEAGPPPELPPELESPTLAMTLGRRRPQVRRRTMLLAAALVTLALAFLGGYAVGNGGGGGGTPAVRSLELVGTKAAPDALAALRIHPGDRAGNWPMTLDATGLPRLPPKGYYTVWLMRGHKPLAPCGTFVAPGRGAGVSVTLNAPYEVRRGDWWAVTMQMPGKREIGPIVLRPKTA